MKKISNDKLVALFMLLLSIIAAVFLLYFSFKIVTNGLVEAPLFFSILLIIGALICLLVGIGFILVIYLCIKYLLTKD